MFQFALRKVQIHFPASSSPGANGEPAMVGPEKPSYFTYFGVKKKTGETHVFSAIYRGYKSYINRLELHLYLVGVHFVWMFINVDPMLPIPLVGPLPSNSHHHNYYIFSTGFP